MAFTFYKKDDREYAELAAEIQGERQIYFYRDGEDYTSPKEHVRFRIFEPMPMDVVAVDQAAENDIPMALMAGLENLRINREENPWELLNANRLLYINVADSETYSAEELSVIRAAFRSRIKDIGWESDRKSMPYLFYKVNDRHTHAQLADQVNAEISSMSDTLGEEFDGRTVNFEFNIFVPMDRDVVAEEPAVDNGDNEQPAGENEGNEEPADQNGRNEPPAAENLENDEQPVQHAGNEVSTDSDVKPEGLTVKDVKKEEPDAEDDISKDLTAGTDKLKIKTPKEEVDDEEAQK
ncbi:unnamed protein product [Caenorhabditis nigoni]